MNTKDKLKWKKEAKKEHGNFTKCNAVARFCGIIDHFKRVKREKIIEVD